MNRRLIAAATLMLAGDAVAQQFTTVSGTGDPTIDVPAVQAAVDQGGHVILKGHFSFGAAPTVPEQPSPDPGLAGGMVLISKTIAISGAVDDQGEMTSIEAGMNPFYVEAPGAHVTIQQLHFIHPKIYAIRVVAVTGLVIASNRFEGIIPAAGSSAQTIVVATSAGPPSASNPGQPENVSGALLIVNNDFDIQATAGTNYTGLNVFAVGKSPDKEVDLYISGNNFRNGTGRQINVWSVDGRVYIERNSVTTPTFGANTTPSGDVIHIVGPGSFLVAHNIIDCQWTSGQQAGIRLQTTANRPVSSAVVVDNDVNMSAPEGAKFTATSAAIEIRGAGDSNIVVNNRIRGRANFALSVANQNGTPQNTAFIMNDLSGFTSAQADVFVDAGGMNTIAVGAQSRVEDHGSGTLIVPVR